MKESKEEERLEGEEFEIGENIYESPTQLNQMFSAQKETVTPSQSFWDSRQENENKEREDDEELEIFTHSLVSDFMIKFIPPIKITSKGSTFTLKRPLKDHKTLIHGYER